MLAEAARSRLIALLANSDVLVAYYLPSLPKGVLSAARGGVGLLFAPQTTSHQRYEQAQRLRFQLMGILPPGHSEIVILNDTPPPVAAAAIDQGVLIHSRNEAERLEYEVLALSQVLDFDEAARRFLGHHSSPQGGPQHDRSG